MYDPLSKSDDDSTCCYGLHRDGRKWIDWRGSGENRKVWQTVCSAVYLAEMGVYFYFIGSSITLWIIGAFFTIKSLVEIWGQSTPTWVCPGTYCMFFVCFGMIFPGVAFVFGYCTKATDIEFAGRDALGMFLYFFGSLYSLSYELHRFFWKAQAENKGKLHTVGLAAVCIHPNYFGDIFTYTGWALAAGTYCALSLPIFMIWSFAIFVIPNSDNYLAQRYPDEFPSYAESTATLIPFFKSQTGLLILGWICFFVSMYWQCTRCNAPCGM